MSECVDVLIATCNGEKYVKEQIESILNQTYKNIKVIVSDDRSDDSTPNILKELAEKDSRITLNLQQERLGVVGNFEFLLKQVQSNYYMLSDQDDFWLPEKIEKSVQKLEEDGSDFVFGDLEVVDQDLNTIYPSFGDFMLLNRKIKKYIGTNKLNYLYNCVTGCTVLGKKEFIEKILPIPTISKYLIHDHWMGLMMSIYGKNSYIEEKYIKYRQHGNNQVGTNKLSHKFTKMDDVRELFINVKLGVFETYVKNNDKFPEELQKLNTEAYEYFKMIQNKKNFNFRQWNVFHELYKTEKFMYYMENFLIMNLPFFGRILFKIRHFILKLQGKR